MLQLHPLFRGDHVGAQCRNTADDFLTVPVVVTIWVIFQKNLAVPPSKGVYIGAIFFFRFSIIHFVTDNFLDNRKQGLGIHQAENRLRVQVAHVILQQPDPVFQHFQFGKRGDIAFDSRFCSIFDELLGDVLEISVVVHIYLSYIKHNHLGARRKNRVQHP